MEKLLKYCLSILLIGTIYNSCSDNYDYYSADHINVENEALAEMFEIGAYRYYQGDPGNMVLLEKASQLDPENASYYREIGVPFLKRGFPVEFYDYYKKSVDLDALNWQGWRGYLYLYFYRDYERALIDFDATDTLTPDFVDYPQSLSVDYMRGICYLHLNQPRKTIAYIDKHVALEDSTVGRTYIDSKSFIMLGKANQQLGKLDVAMENYKEALNIEPEVASIYFHMASLYKLKGDIENAKKYGALAQTSYDRDIVYRRNYMDEFFKIYQTDLDKLHYSLNNRE